MTQKDLSAKTGITQADISRIENGTRNPSLSMVKKTCTEIRDAIKAGICSDANKKIKCKEYEKIETAGIFHLRFFLCPAIYRNTAIEILLYYDSITNLFHL